MIGANPAVNRCARFLDGDSPRAKDGLLSSYWRDVVTVMGMRRC